MPAGIPLKTSLVAIPCMYPHSSCPPVMLWPGRPSRYAPRPAAYAAEHVVPEIVRYHDTQVSHKFLSPETRQIMQSTHRPAPNPSAHHIHPRSKQIKPLPIITKRRPRVRRVRSPKSTNSRLTGRRVIRCIVIATPHCNGHEDPGVDNGSGGRVEGGGAAAAEGHGDDGAVGALA